MGDGPNSIQLPGDTPIPDAPVPVIRSKYEGPQPSTPSQRTSRRVKEAMPGTRLQWISTIATIIVALGGGAGLRELFARHPLPPPAMTKDQAAELIKKVDAIADRQDAEIKKTNEHRWALYDALNVRAEIHDSVLCRLNMGQSFARRVDCETIPSGDWQSVPLGQELSGPFKVDYDLPRIPRPPDPRPK